MNPTAVEQPCLFFSSFHESVHPLCAVHLVSRFPGTAFAVLGFIYDLYLSDTVCMHGIECATGWLTRPALPCPAQTDPFPIEPTPKGAQASQLSQSEIAPPRPKPTPIAQNEALKAPWHPGAMHRQHEQIQAVTLPCLSQTGESPTWISRGALLKGISQASQWG